MTQNQASMRYTMNSKDILPPVRRQRRLALFKSLLIPVLTLAFFLVAPHWLNVKLRTELSQSMAASPAFTPAQREEWLVKIATMDFDAIGQAATPGLEKLHDHLVAAGVAANFQRLHWGLGLALLLALGLDAAVWIIYALNERAKRSQADLIRSYQLAWRISMVSAIATLFLLIPLLTYAVFEFSVILTDHYIPKLLFLIVLLGGLALLNCGVILFKKIPLEFHEPMAREVAPAEAPELWQAVRQAAGRLATSPPDRIIIGMQLNFYVTELEVKHDGGRTRGKALFLSLPLLKLLSEAEVTAIIGHELGHFIGEDTRLTREFFPLRLKARATLVAMARSGWVGWPSFQFLNFFGWCFGETEKATSRSRELLADQQAATLTSPATAARALVRFQVAVEAFQRHLKSAIHRATGELPNRPLALVVRETLAAEPEFWTRLFEQKQPHPLDSHPALHVRLDSLGQPMSAAEAQALAGEDSVSAYDQWLSHHPELFTSLDQQTAKVLADLQSRSAVVAADYGTPGGRELLDRLFPAFKWRVRPAAYGVGLAFLGVFILLGLLLALEADVPSARLIGLMMAGVSALTMVIQYQRHYRSELLLTAEGLRYSGWCRPLRFADVQTISAAGHYSNLILTFHWKTRQPPLWKLSLLRLPGRRETLSLSMLPGKPLANGQLILRYFTRQRAPDPKPQ